MNYYKIALPIKIEKLYTYKSTRQIEKGCRVYISFNNSFHTGIVWEQSVSLNEAIKYKEILEIIDQESKIPVELLKLAEWISRYYQCSLGIALSAMLPTAFNVLTQLKIRKKKNTIVENEQLNIFFKGKDSSEWTDLKILKKQIEINGLPNLLEELEEQSIIEIQRTFDQKIKKKIANYIVLENPIKLPELTFKQASVYKELQKIGDDFPLATIVQDYTFYILKKLRDLNLLKIVPREIKSINDILPKTRQEINLTLTDEQKSAVARITKKLSTNTFCTFLIYGITGSGKTEVYIEAIKQTLQDGKTALMLVPEISLTPQMVERFFNAFGQDIAILHSHLNEREKWEQWNKIKSGKSRIVIGARSAIFAPLENIGIIIVDEEHETSYKQDSAPRYNGRDIAIVRAKISDAVIVLGTATPSLESWNNALSTRYELIKLTKRPYKIKLPEVHIVDMRVEEDTKQLLSKVLKEKIEQKLDLKEQIILLHNRRGHSSFVQCVTCGRLFKCNDCDISLNFHSRNQTLLCHYCGKKQEMPRKCPDCGSYKFSFGAAGTQQIEKYLQIVFPKARILRMDSDSARKKDSYDSMFERMKNGNVDILLGTQMIAKGLDFKNVTLVGVILADIGLNIPDFRAAERTFQLLTQVAGRSGRGEKSGEVIIQTFNPEHYAIRFAMAQNFEGFAREELELRENLKYPPYYKIARVVFSNKEEKRLRQQVFQNIKMFDNIKNLFNNSVHFLGPIQAPLVKIQNQYRYHLILKSNSVKALSQAVNYIKQNIKLSSTIKLTIDIDPYSLL